MRIFYLLLIASVFNFFSCQSNIQKPVLPNVVLIFTDDLGYGDLVSYGAYDYQTPHLDKLAAQGMRFTHFYSAQAVCSASRAGLLTGCYPNRIGISGALFPHHEIGLNPDEMTIAELLKQKDYATAIVGKWHLGHHEKFLPLQHGFDEYFGIPYSNDMWPVKFDGEPAPEDHRKHRFPPLPLIKGNETIETLDDLPAQDQITTRYTEYAVDFINRSADKPFFLYFAHTMPHVPLGVSDKFRGKSDQGMYGDVIMEIDWSAGQVLAALDSNGVTDNTIVIFTSDNGAWLNFWDHAGSSAGLREGKLTTFDGGQRVPCIVRWPGQIPEGVVCNQLASTLDFFPTLAGITNTIPSENKIDGVDILPLLKGDMTATPRETMAYYLGKNSLRGVRKDNYKLVLPHKYRSYYGPNPGGGGVPGGTKMDSTGYALYDLRRDPGEQYNLIEYEPDIAAALKVLAESFREELGDDLTGREGSNVRKVGRL